MENLTDYRKLIKILSVISIIAGVLCFILAAMAGIAGTAVYDTGDQTSIVGGSYDTGVVLMAGSLVLIVLGIINLIIGIAGVRYAADQSRTVSYYVLFICSLVGVVFAVISAIYELVNGGGIGNAVGELVSGLLDALVLYGAVMLRKKAVK